jgi:hypothetical protein
VKGLLLLTALLAASCDDDDGMPHVHDAGAHDLRIPLDALPTVGGPMKLSETGLYSDFAARTLAPGVMSFTPRYQLWSDGADKQRYLLLPPGTTIDTSDMDRWVFPVGTKAWKEFRSGGTLVETRLLQKVEEGSDGWWMMAYLWNDSYSEADAVVLGRDDAHGTTHRVPSQEDCFVCHLGAGDTLIGVSALQLGFGEIPGSGNVKDALGYLHGNCGHCHNEDGFLATKVKLRLKQLVGVATPEESPTYKSAIYGKTMHNLDGTIYAVVPGKPEESQLHQRMGLRNQESMPPVCTKRVDADGMRIVGDWIRSLP